MAEQLVGITVAGCKVIKLLGKGGMGSVYLARQVDLGRFVAVKVLSKNLIQEEGFLRRFKREARAVASLSHPNVVQLFQYGEEDGIHFIVMEYVEGKTAGTLLGESGCLEEAEAIRIIRESAQGIQEAQKKGIVHRDMKPDNILLNLQGEVKVTDFGLAKNLSGSQNQSLVTKQIIGTPAYISPEQIKGSEIDPRSDLYSLGATMYHFVAGRPPFTAKNPFELLEKHLKEKPLPPGQVKEGVSQAVSDVIMKCLAKDPKKRYQTAAELIEDLERVEEGSKTLAAATVGRGIGLPVKLGIAAVLIAGLAWFGVKIASPSESGANPPVDNGSNNGGTNGVGVTQLTPEEKLARQIKELIDYGETLEHEGSIESAIIRYKEALELKGEDADLAAKIEELEARVAEQARKEELRDLRNKVLGRFFAIISGGGDEPTAEELTAAITDLEAVANRDPTDFIVKNALDQARSMKERLEKPQNDGGPPDVRPPDVGPPVVGPPDVGPDVEPNGGNGGVKPGNGEENGGENGDEPLPQKFDGTVWLKNGNPLVGTITVTETHFIIDRYTGGRVTIPKSDAERVERDDTGVRLKGLPGAGESKELELNVGIQRHGEGWATIRYTFSNQDEIKDWVLKGGRLDTGKEAVGLGSQGTLRFGTPFDGDMIIKIEVVPKAPGVFQTRIFSHNIYVYAGKAYAPGLGKGWDVERVPAEDKDTIRLYQGIINYITITKAKSKVYLEANFSEPVLLEGDIVSGLGDITFGTDGTSCEIHNVEIFGHPRP